MFLRSPITLKSSKKYDNNVSIPRGNFTYFFEIHSYRFVILCSVCATNLVPCRDEIIGNRIPVASNNFSTGNTCDSSVPQKRANSTICRLCPQLAIVFFLQSSRIELSHWQHILYWNADELTITLLSSGHGEGG